MESNGVDEVMIFIGDLKRIRAMTDGGREKFNDGIMSATDKISNVQPNKLYYFLQIQKFDRGMFDHHFFFSQHSVGVCEERGTNCCFNGGILSILA